MLLIKTVRSDSKNFVDIINGVNNNSNSQNITQYFLSQNYPNPFNPTTSINYTIPKRGFVELKVYDLLDRKVAQLVNEEKSVGNYQVEFDASNLSSGVYLYKIKINSFVAIKKMIITK